MSDPVRGGVSEVEDGNRIERDPWEWYDEERREVALVYREYLDRVREDEAYERTRRRHRERYGDDE